MPQPSITEICLKIKWLKFYSNFHGVNELIFTKGWSQWYCCHHIWTSGEPWCQRVSLSQWVSSLIVALRCLTYGKTLLQLVEVMACHMLSGKPLPESVLIVSWPSGIKFSGFWIKIFHSTKYIWKRRQNFGHCVQVSVNTLRPRQDGRYFADNVLKCIFLNENVWISLKIPLKFVPRDPINNIRALVQKMAWRRPGDKPLSEPMLVFVPTHICVTRPQWVKKMISVWRYATTGWRMTLPLTRLIVKYLNLYCRSDMLLALDCLLDVFCFIGFSRTITGLLKEQGVKYGSFNILEDEEVRQGKQHRVNSLTHCGLVTPYGHIDLESTLAQVMACCLTAPSHYLNQCWFSIKYVLWHSPESNSIRSAHEHNICLKMSLLKLLLLLSGANKLINAFISRHLPN